MPVRRHNIPESHRQHDIAPPIHPIDILDIPSIILAAFEIPPVLVGVYHCHTVEDEADHMCEDEVDKQDQTYAPDLFGLVAAERYLLYFVDSLQGVN